MISQDRRAPEKRPSFNAASWLTAVVAVVAACAFGANPRLEAQVPGDTTTYANEQTRDLINGARLRHLVQDTLVKKYRATITSRADGRFAPGDFDRGFPAFSHQMASRISWSAPNRLNMEVLGSRLESARIPGWSDRAWNGFWVDLFSAEPFFVPRAFNDSIQMIGVPSTAALHPLAVEGELYYRYSIVDTTTMESSIRTIRAVQIEVEPKAEGPSFVAGKIWVDAGTLDVVRMAIVFVGTEVLDDDEDEELEMTHAEANLEYALYENLAWMPQRQIILVGWKVPLAGGLRLRSQIVTEFSDYVLNPGTPSLTPVDGPTITRRNHRMAWDCDEVMMFGDAERIEECGSSWIRSSTVVNGIEFTATVPPLDSLEAFVWEEPLELDATAAERDAGDEVIAELARVATDHYGLRPSTPGKSNSLLTVARKAPRFNRVQGLSLGWDEQVTFPGTFSSIAGSARFGLSDKRLLATVAFRRDAPESFLEVSVGRSLRETEPWTNGQSLGASAKSLFLGWDDGDYFLAEGGFVRLEGRTGFFRNKTLRLGFERQSSVASSTGSVINDVLFGERAFQANPSIAKGDFAVGSLEHRDVNQRRDIRIGVGGQVSDSLIAGRVWGAIAFPLSIGDSRILIRASAGTVFGDSLPQLNFRLGGPQTVPGFHYGFGAAESFSALSAEWELVTSDWVAPVLIGGVATPLDEFDSMVGLGVGLAFFQNWFRIDVTGGVQPSTSPRVDFYFQIPR